MRTISIFKTSTSILALISSIYAANASETENFDEYELFKDLNVSKSYSENKPILNHQTLHELSTLEEQLFSPISSQPKKSSQETFIEALGNKESVTYQDYKDNKRLILDYLKKGNTNARAALGILELYNNHFPLGFRFLRGAIKEGHRRAEVAMVEVLAELSPPNDVLSQVSSNIDKLALQNNTEALYLKGLQTDLEGSLTCMVQAAQKGYSRAQYKAGLYNLERKFSDSSLSNAIYWLVLAANQGHQEASRKIDELYYFNPNLNNDQQVFNTLSNLRVQSNSYADYILSKFPVSSNAFNLQSLAQTPLNITVNNNFYFIAPPPHYSLTTSYFIPTEYSSNSSSVTSTLASSVESLASSTDKKNRKRKGEENDFNFLEIVKKKKEFLEKNREKDAPQENKVDENSLRKIFGDKINYALTDDQKKAIEDIKQDEKSTGNKERVIIAPVGAGKTEVAMHATLEKIKKKKQVIVLSPRCVLAEQHYNKFKERFEGIAKVGFLRASDTKSKKQKIYAKIAKGKYDIVVGTLSLLKDEIKYSNLGLVVIDEEQGFGVKHKSYLSEKYPSAYTLILTATPIPRTQELIKTGYYKSSQILTMPQGRLPIKVFLNTLEQMDPIIEAIKSEKERKGQIFFVSNKIQSLSKLETFLASKLPTITFKVLHGEMKEEEKTRTLKQFRRSKFDLLLSTNIIGVGVDIPNANTMIIHDADKFGLADLYQFKGRVGRSSIQGYTYLLYDAESITDTSLAKLQAIEKYTDLNDCSTISKIDYELRGRGDVGSDKQHGHLKKHSLSILQDYLV